MAKKTEKETYYAIAAKRNRQKKKAEELYLRTRNEFLELSVPILKRKHKTLVEEYDSLLNSNNKAKASSKLEKANNQLLKDEVSFYRNYKSRTLDLMFNLRQEAKLQKSIFQVRKNFYQILSSVSKISLKIAPKPKVESCIMFNLNGASTKLDLKMYFNEKRINGSLKQTMTIDINQIPMDFMRLSNTWNTLHEDKFFMRKLGIELSAGETLQKTFFNELLKERQTILSNSEFCLKSRPGYKSFFLSGMHKEETEVTFVKTVLPDVTKSLESMKKCNALLFKAATFRQAQKPGMCNLSVLFYYDDPPVPVVNDFSKEAFVEVVKEINSPDRNMRFVESLLKHCLVIAG